MGPWHGTKYWISLSLCASALLALELACSGKPFEADQPCRDQGCGAETNGEAGADGTSAGEGGKTSGGSSNGGRAGSAQGGSDGGEPEPGGGAGPLGGKGGLGGLGGSAGLPGVSGGGPGEPPAFPATGVLDDFDREGPALGEKWTGLEYSLAEQALWCELCAAPALWGAVFGSQQEVFAKLAAFGNDAGEINLVLKAQNADGCDLIEVLYSPAEHTTFVAYCVAGEWTNLEAKPLTLSPGDRFGARALANGSVEIYAGDELVITIDASGFPYEGGRIGVNGVSGDTGLSWDDFGGGNWN
jgi:hypothetical protein